MYTTEDLLKKYERFSAPVVKEFDRRMMDSMLLSKDGNDENRIGKENKRKENPFIEEGEDTLLELLPLPLTCDIRPIHPPYFREFSYTDMMGGLLLSSLSAEITARIRAEAAECKASGDFPLHTAMDKYALKAPGRQKFRKVFFMPGSNLLNILDRSVLTRLIKDEEWVVKPHPVSNDQTIKDLIAMFGGDRILPKQMSGHELFESAEEVATTAASEFAIKAALAGKKLINATSEAEEDTMTYGSITRLFTGDVEKDWTIANNVLMSDLSGYLTASNGTERNRDLVKMFSGRAMEIREQFKMTTSQRLIVTEVIPGHWIGRGK